MKYAKCVGNHISNFLLKSRIAPLADHRLSKTSEKLCSQKGGGHCKFYADLMVGGGTQKTIGSVTPSELRMLKSPRASKAQGCTHRDVSTGM